MARAVLFAICLVGCANGGGPPARETFDSGPLPPGQAPLRPASDSGVPDGGALAAPDSGLGDGGAEPADGDSGPTDASVDPTAPDAGCVPATEVCNGVDDDCNGMVDELTRACSTACGVRLERCIDGRFGECSAPPASSETCNLVDDDCNGRCDDLVGGCRAAVHRSLLLSSGVRRYTSSRAEAECCGFTPEAYDYFFVYPSRLLGLDALHRCRLTTGFELYTTSPTCEDRPGATNEGILGFVATTPSCESVPLFHLTLGSDHFYTARPADRDTAIGLGYSLAGIAGHVWPTR